MDRAIHGCLVLILLAYLGQLSQAQNYCTRTSFREVIKQEEYVVDCGWTVEACTRYRDVVVRESYERRVCCDGYVGAFCNIPTCVSGCNGGVCIGPNRCYCKETSGTAERCETVYCTFEKNCYPGSCEEDIQQDGTTVDTCRCSSGFDGENCQQIRTAPRFVSCSAQLLKDGEVVFQGDCLTDTDTATYYTNQRDFGDIRVHWETTYDVPDDIPVKKSYISNFQHGIAAAYTNITLLTGADVQEHFHTMPCGTLSITQETPFQSPQCHGDIYNIGEAISNGYKLNIEMEAVTGGFKEIYDSARPPGETHYKEFYEGMANSQKVPIVFDLLPPKHCSQPSPGDCDPGETVFLSVAKDINNDPSFNIYWFGWEDDRSGVSNYTYEVYELVPRGSRLQKKATPLTVVEWDMTLTSLPTYTPPGPGMYSVELKVYDRATNYAHARTLVLWDRSSNITVAASTPTLRVDSTTDQESNGYRWLTTQLTGANTLALHWDNHFQNKVHKDKHLLDAVEPLDPNGNAYDDTQGDRTVDTIPNVDGIVKFEVTHALRDTETPTAAYTPVGLATSYKFTAPLADGNLVKFWVRATDVMGNTMVDSVIVGVDRTPPSVQNPKFAKDIQTDFAPFSSGVEFTAFDLESGLSEVRYKLYDNGGGTRARRATALVTEQTLTIEPVNKNAQACTIDGDCICSSATGQCFNKLQYAYVDHCWLAGLDGHSFSMDIEVANGAQVTSPLAFTLGALSDLTGVGVYLPPTEMKLTETDNPAKNMITWKYPESCYTPKEVVLKLGKTEIRLPQQPTVTNSHTFDKLKPETEFTLELYIVYTDGKQSSTANFQFMTPDYPWKQPFPVGGIVGVVLAVIVLVLLAVVIVLVIVKIRQKKPIPMVPKRVNNRLSVMFYPEAGRNNYNETPPPGATDNPVYSPRP